MCRTSSMFHKFHAIVLASLLLSSADAFGVSPFSSSLSSSTSTSTAEPMSTPVVICPGFGNDSIDYSTPLSQPIETGFIYALEKRGFETITTVPVKRSDWIRVAGGLLDGGFYTNSAKPTGRGYGWYVKRLKETVDEVYEQTGEKVLLVGHSAGGWLARAAMGDGLWDEETNVRTSDKVRCLVTIGAIHKPPQDLGKCVTRGALAYVDANYPGAYLKEEGVAYCSVGGDAVVGSKEEVEQFDDADTSRADEVYAKKVAFTSYEAVCGEGAVTGDGVVPLEWSVLEGARHLPLPGVVHSINEAGTTIPTDKWYGADGVVDQWLPTVLEEAGIARPKTAAAGLGEALQRMLQFQ